MRGYKIVLVVAVEVQVYSDERDDPNDDGIRESVSDGFVSLEFGFACLAHRLRVRVFGHCRLVCSEPALRCPANCQSHIRSH